MTSSIFDALIEAAQDLYASRAKAFLRVTLPLSLPGVVAGTLLTFIPAADAVAGDFNSDGNVNDLDFAKWKSDFGKWVAPGGGADGNRNGTVDAADYARMLRVSPRIFDNVLANVRTLIRARGAASHPFVVVQFLLDRHNVARLPEMYDLGASLGVDRIAVNAVLDVPNERT